MKLPRVSGREVIRRLKRAGYVATRQRGDHVRLEKQDYQTVTKITVPLHKELKTGTLLRIIKDAGLTRDDFDKLK